LLSIARHARDLGSPSARAAKNQRRRRRTAGDRAGKQNRQFIGSPPRHGDAPAESHQCTQRAVSIRQDRDSRAIAAEFASLRQDLVTDDPKARTRHHLALAVPVAATKRSRRRRPGSWRL
jgi:hypothetical protein